MLEFETDAGERLEDAEGVLLNDGVLGSAIERIKVGRVETIERSEDRAVVRAELSLAGESFVNEFALEGAPGSLFTRDSWQLTSPLIGLVAIELPSETDMLPDGIAVDLGGERLAVEHSVFAIGEPLAVALVYPARYRLSLEANEYFEPQAAEALAWPLNGESRDRLTGLAIGSMFGSVEDPEAVLLLQLNEKFAESMLASGLALAQACAVELGVFATVEGERIPCPPLTNPAAVDACLANPSSHLGEYGGAQFLCNYYRTFTPFRASVEAVAASTATATLEEDSGWLYKLGPYRFTDSQSGASFEASVHYAELQWVEGKPVAHGGSFTSED